jgi:outer membrane biosynthesis protein TonB
MTLRLPTRALAPVIVLVVLAGIAASFMVYRTMPSGAESSLTPTPEPKRLPARKPATKPATKPAAKTNPAATKPKTKAKTKAAAPKTKPAVVPAAPAVKPVEAPKGDPVDANGLPLVLARALAKHPVTVVALYDPAAAIDEMALAEARAGAAEVGAGFLALSIRNEPQVRPLTQLHGVLESPSVLVYERPKTLFVRLTGFSDRETVAQAAANARR